MYFLILSIIVLILVFFCKLFWNLILIKYYTWDLPGPIPLPIFGNIFWFRVKHLKDIYHRYNGLFKQYGRLFTFWLGPVPMIFTSKPDLAKAILTNPSTLDKSSITRHVLDPIFGKSFVLALENEWRPRRKIVSSSLNQATINSFVPLFVKESEYFVKEMEKELDIGKPFDIHEYTNRVSLQTICGTALGVDMRKVDYDYGKFFEAVNCIYKSVLERLLKFWLIPNFVFQSTLNGKFQKHYVDIISNMINQVLKEKKMKTRPNNNINLNSGLINQDDNIIKDIFQRDFLDFLLNIPNYGDDKIIHEVTFLILAGFESSSAIASYCLLALAAQPDIQRNVYEEIYCHFGNSNRPIEVHDLNKLDYLERVIKETLRLYPPIAYLWRNNQKFIQFENVKFPPNINFIISIFHLHRDPEVWEDPLVFNPDRFLPEHIEKRHPYSYIPFGQGPRICPGSKYALTFIKVLIINVLRNYELHTHLKLEELEFLLDISLELYNGHLITINKRDKNK